VARAEQKISHATVVEKDSTYQFDGPRIHIMKNTLFLLTIIVAVSVFVAQREIAQTTRMGPRAMPPQPVNPPQQINPPAQSGSVTTVYPPEAVHAARVRPSPSIQIRPELPLTEPIRIEVGEDIAASVEIRRVSGAEIRVVAAVATHIRTSGLRVVSAESP
jgi:hypothetical protein